MKLKKLWIPMLIFTLIGGTAKICDTLLNVYGNGFIFHSTVCNGIFIISAALVLIIGWVMSFMDRKKNIPVTASKNIFCGLFGFIASVTIIGSGLLSFISSSPNIVHCILSILGGGVLLFESCVSFTGQNGMTKVPLLSLAVPVWCCSRFMLLFTEYTQKSILATEIFDIIAVAMLLMFLFYQSMFFAGINTAAAVRRSTVYGMVFITLGLVVSADLFIKMFMPSLAVEGIDSEIVNLTLINILSCIGDIALCAYAFLFSHVNMKAAEAYLIAHPENEADDEESEEEPPEKEKPEEKIPEKEKPEEKSSEKEKPEEESSEKEKPEEKKPVGEKDVHPVEAMLVEEKSETKND